MRTTLADVIVAARDHELPIIHISRLAGEEPFIASSPCLGNASVPLLDIGVDDYLGLMAEIRNTMHVEHDEVLEFPIITGGARDAAVAAARVQLPPRNTSGALAAAWGTAAIYYLMDSAGQETTIVYDGLRSFADIQTYWERRGKMWRDFVDRFSPVDEDLHDLSYRLDRTIAIDAFDLNAFAAQRGLLPSARYAVH